MINIFYPAAKRPMKFIAEQTAIIEDPWESDMPNSVAYAKCKQ